MAFAHDFSSLQCSSSAFFIFHKSCKTWPGVTPCLLPNIHPVHVIRWLSSCSQNSVFILLSERIDCTRIWQRLYQNLFLFISGRMGSCPRARTRDSRAAWGPGGKMPSKGLNMKALGAHTCLYFSSFISQAFLTCVPF